MIRKAEIGDINDIMEIVKGTIREMHSYNNFQWDESYPKSENFIDDIKNGDLFVSEVDGKLGGFVCVNKIEPEEYEGLGWSLPGEALVVHRMAVNPDFRRMGIGTELIKFADEMAAANNIEYLKTDTYSINEKMNSLFKKCGYSFVGEMNFLSKEKAFYCYEKILRE